MGCNGSKSTGTENSQKQDGPTGDNIPMEEAEEYLKKELGISDERAKKLVQKANTYKDNKVQKSEMEKLRKEVTEIKEEVCARFVKYDKDTSGRVTTDEAMTVLKEKFPNVNEDSLKCMIKRYDLDGSGNIHYNEFIYFYANIKYKKEDLQNKWRELDKDKTGKLNPHEASKLLEEECALDERMAKSLFEDFDLNKDGHLDREEFESLFISMFG